MSTEDHWAYKLPLWHGYPLGEGSDRERPWWHRTEFGWRRMDGAYTALPKNWKELGTFTAVVRGLLARVDRDHPLPAPPPRVGQVWLALAGRGCLEHSVHGMVTNVRDGGAMYWLSGMDKGQEEWPPEGMVLVAGPLSPWAPMGEP